MVPVTWNSIPNSPNSPNITLSSKTPTKANSSNSAWVYNTSKAIKSSKNFPMEISIKMNPKWSKAQCWFTHPSQPERFLVCSINSMCGTVKLGSLRRWVDCLTECIGFMCNFIKMVVFRQTNAVKCYCLYLNGITTSI